jgi:hypothetical protein
MWIALLLPELSRGGSALSGVVAHPAASAIVAHTVAKRSSYLTCSSSSAGDLARGENGPTF